MIRLLLVVVVLGGGCLTETGAEAPVDPDLPACGPEQQLVADNGQTGWCSAKVVAGDAGAPEGGR